MVVLVVVVAVVVVGKVKWDCVRGIVMYRMYRRWQVSKIEGEEKRPRSKRRRAGGRNPNTS